MLSVIIMQNKKVQYKMENNELKNICIKNLSHHYFDDRIKLEDFDLDNILIDEKWHENILIYDISYKTLTGSKPLGIRFDKIDRIIRIYDGTRYITLLGTKKYGAVYDRIRFRISLKSNITYVFCQYLWFLWFLPIPKTLTLHNVLLLINKDKNRYSYEIFLEKFSYQWAKKSAQIFFHSIIMVKFGEKQQKNKFYDAKKKHKNLGC